MRKIPAFFAFILITAALNAQTSFQDTDFSYGNISLSKPLTPAPVLLPISNEDKPIKKGDVLISGSGSLSFQTTRYETEETISRSTSYGVGIYPGISFFVVNGLSIGGNLTLGVSASEGNFSYDVGIGPDIRYYFNFGLLTKFEGSYVFSHSETSSSNYFALKPAIGFAIFLNNKVALEPCFFYRMRTQGYTYETWSTSFMGHNFGAEIGLSIFL